MITAAYRIRCAKLEPLTDAESINEMKLVQWAYEVLGNERERAGYDARHAQAPSATEGASAVIQYVDAPGEGSGRLWRMGMLLAVLAGCGVYLYAERAGNTARLAVVADSKPASAPAAAPAEPPSTQVAQSNPTQGHLDGQRLAQLQSQFEQQSQRDSVAEAFRERNQAMQNFQEKQMQAMAQMRANREQAYFACYNAAKNAMQEANCARWR